MPLDGDETAQQLLQRIHVPTLRTGVEGIDGHGGLYPGEVLEVAGPHASGKTETLCHIALQCLLPKAFGGMESAKGMSVECLFGREGVAVFVDLDGKFDGHRFFRILEKRIREAGSSDVDAVKKACLMRFLYIRCNSSFEFLSFLKVMPSVLSNKELPARVGCLLIDNILAYCWSDKANEPDKNDVHAVPMTFQRVQQSVYAELERILDTLHCFLVITKNTTTEVQLNHRGFPQWEQRELIQHRLQSLYTQRLILVPVMHLPEILKGQLNLDPRGLLAKWMSSDEIPFLLDFKFGE